MCYDFQGRPISVEQWSALLASPDRIVEQTRVFDYEVSTVWLGLDHGGGEIPVIFETMVWDTSPDQAGYLIMRWVSWEQAQQAHDQIVATLRDMRALPS